MWIQTSLVPLWLELSPRGVRRLEPAFYPQDPFPQNPSPLAREVEARIRAYFQGLRPGFSDLPLDYAGLSPWRVSVYEWVRGIPYGEVRSYKEVGQALALPARAVGMALRTCPFFLLVPAHRVVHADGRLGGFAGLEGLKARLLRLEGLDLTPDGHLKGGKRGAF
ncbi:methylated-DNA--[protein]-cysteine S-methyltransferase [Thermus filiformis]|uniref:methylated-DNA--[protein]-cysteine S-methyltransferase n=1 Tax=Thermus filiformis TaxID=276 RepID=UPI000530DF12|nr:MGMT family protein [Thermus filiformis]